MTTDKERQFEFSFFGCKPSCSRQDLLVAPRTVRQKMAPLGANVGPRARPHHIAPATGFWKPLKPLKLKKEAALWY